MANISDNWEIDYTNKNIKYVGAVDNGVKISDLYNYFRIIWGKEDLRKKRREKLDKLNEIQNNDEIE